MFRSSALDSVLTGSMGTIGNDYQNSQTESLRARTQAELLERKRGKSSRALSTASLSQNYQWLHFSLGLAQPNRARAPRPTKPNRLAARPLQTGRCKRNDMLPTLRRWNTGILDRVSGKFRPRSWWLGWGDDGACAAR